MGVADLVVAIAKLNVKVVVMTGVMEVVKAVVLLLV